VKPRCNLLNSLVVVVSLVCLQIEAYSDSLAQQDGVAVPLKARAFRLEDVRLFDGPFKRAMELDRQYLLSLDVDRLLHNFRVNARLPSSAEPLGGWEEPNCELRGHFVGHYLSGCAMMYAGTGDKQLKEKGNAIVSGLAECQAKIGSGYLSAYPEEFIDRVEARKRVWAPYYTLHKIYAGLLDMYVYCDNEQALDVCRNFADWAIARNARLSEEQMQSMLDAEHGGMNETLANLYGLTGDRKYLEIAERFNHMAVIEPASKRRDMLTGLHANTQIPKFVGTARQYELTGDEWLKTASVFFWDTVVNERSYVIGGHSDGELFSPKERLSEALGPNTTETCNTYNMLKLTRHLFCWEPRAEYADYYERALYNHILASQNPETGMMCYYVPLRSGSKKAYNTPNDSFWCCTGTGVENHAKYGDSIYFHSDTDLWVNLFVASELSWKAKGLKLRQETTFPEAGASKLTFELERPLKLNLNIRRPYWASEGFEVLLNGRKTSAASNAGSYMTLSRTWESGDTVEIVMPFNLRTEGFRDNPRRIAFMNGPLVLCAEVSAAGSYPAIVAEPEDLLGGFEAVDGRASTFDSATGIFRVPGQNAPANVRLEPFYKVHGDRRYAVYWDVFTEEQWQEKEEQYRAEIARRKELEERTVDYVLPGNPQNERDHNLQGENTGAGDFSDRKWRHATDGGWFSYALKVLPDQPAELSVTYWGGDAGNRAFDILVDGVKIAAERLENNRPGEFYDQVYPIPESLTKDKTKVTVRFQAHSGSWAGGIFGLYVLRVKPGDASKAEVPVCETQPQIQRNVTFIVTSDAHYDAFENEDRNEPLSVALRSASSLFRQDRCLSTLYFLQLGTVC